MAQADPSASAPPVPVSVPGPASGAAVPPPSPGGDAPPGPQVAPGPGGSAAQLKPALATINAGFDYQVAPSFVFGVFGDYDLHSLKSQVDVNIAAIPLNAHGEISADRQWSIGGRIGYLTSPTTLVFVSGGYTELNLSNFSASADLSPCWL